MPRPDPAPIATETLKRRFWRIFRLLAAFSAVIAVIAVVLVASGQQEWRAHMLIATGLGIWLTMLVGTALMTLTFFSASSGHDDAAGEHRPGPNQEDD